MPNPQNHSRIRSIFLLLLIAGSLAVAAWLVPSQISSAAAGPEFHLAAQVQETATPIPTPAVEGNAPNNGGWAVFGLVVLIAMLAMIAYGVVFVHFLSKLKDRFR